MVNDFTVFGVAQDAYVVSNDPGRFLTWGLGRFVPRRDGLGRPRGVNSAAMDGSVKWTLIGEYMLGYPSCGGNTPYDTCRALQRLRPGRPGYLP